MGFLSKPKAPDASELTRQQGAANRETAITQAGLNMVNQNTPGGSLTYNQIGTWADGTPRYEATQTLSNDQQRLYDQSNRIAGQYGNTAESQFSAVGNRLSQPFSTEQAGFDANAYLRANPDVAQAVQNGSMTAWEHYNRHGRGEGRDGSGMVRSLDLSGLPQMQSSASAPGAVYGIVNAGPIQTGFGDVGSQQRTISDRGPVTRTFADVGGQQRYLDFSPFGDPDISRNSVESALLTRLQPSLDRDRQALETKLSNQGLTPGTQAYDDAFDEFNRQSNDARLAAILNAGNEQSRIFGLGLQAGDFANRGQERDYAQALGRASFYNSGQAQDFGQGISAANLFNQAQAQDFGQARDRAAFANAAQQQQYGQNANDAAFFNQAQQQEFNQSLANANLANQARAQGVNEGLTSANFANQARQNAISESILNRQQPLNELAALLSGVQMQGPSFVNTPQTGVQGTNVIGPAMASYQAQQASRNAALGGLFGLGGSLGGGYLASGGRFW